MSNSLKKVIYSIIGLSFLVYFIYIATAIIFNRSLAEDGSFYFVSLLNNMHNLYSYSHNSNDIGLFVTLMTQLPVSLALKLNIENIPFLRFLYNFVPFLSATVGMFITYWISKRSQNRLFFLVPFAAYVLLIIPFEGRGTNSFLLSFWLYTLILLYTLVDFRLKRIDIILVISCLVLAARSHESLVIIGIIIVITAINNTRRITDTNILLLRVIIAFVMSLEVVYVFWWYYSHSHLKNLFSFINQFEFPSLHNLVNSSISVLMIGIIAIVVFLIFTFTKKKEKQKSYASPFLFSLIFMFFLLFFVWNMSQQSENQSFIGGFSSEISIWLTIFLFLLLIFFRDRYKRMNNSVSLGFILSLILLSQSVGQLYDNYKWHGYTNEIKSVLASSKAGILDKDDMKSRIRDSSFILPWTLPSLSISLSDGYNLKTLMAPPENEGEFGVNREKELIHIPNIDLNPNVFIYPELIESIQNYDLFRHPYHLGDLVDFSGSLDNMILTGWSKPENWGRWTIGGESNIKLVVSPMDLGKPLKLRAEVAGFVADKPQKVKIYVNDVFVDSWIFNNNDEWSQRRLNVSSDLIRSNQPLKISFYIEIPSSPKESNRGDDERKLGLAIKNITIDQQ